MTEDEKHKELGKEVEKALWISRDRTLLLDSRLYPVTPDEAFQKPLTIIPEKTYIKKEEIDTIIPSLSLIQKIKVLLGIEVRIKIFVDIIKKY